MRFQDVMASEEELDFKNSCLYNINHLLQILSQGREFCQEHKDDDGSHHHHDGEMMAFFCV